MRIVPESVKNLLKEDFAETTEVVEIRVPSTDNTIEPITLYLANRQGLVINGQEYSNQLRNLGTIKMSLGQAPDTASFSIENVSLTYSYLVSDENSFIEGSEATIYKVFKVAEDTYHKIALFDGKVSGLRFSQEEISMTLISKMSLKTSQIAKRPLTQRCIWKFKGKECGWVPGMGGDDDDEGTLFNFCDRGWDTPNGCLAHGNIHRFGGLPQFTAVIEKPEEKKDGGYDSNPGGQWGTGPGGGWCVYPEAYILVYMDKPVWKRAYALDPGDKVCSLDRFGKLVVNDVLGVVNGSTTHLHTITTETGLKITCSPSHPILTFQGDNTGTPASSIQVGSEVLTYSFDKAEASIDKVKSIEIFEKDTAVVMLELGPELHTYIAGDEKTGGIVSHNSKQISTKTTVMPLDPGIFNRGRL